MFPGQIARLNRAKQDKWLTTDSTKMQQRTSFWLRHMPPHTQAELYGRLLLLCEQEDSKIADKLAFCQSFVLFHENTSFQEKAYQMIHK